MASVDCMTSGDISVNTYTSPVDMNSVRYVVTRHHEKIYDHDGYTWYDYQRAIDFICSEETPVVAAADGTVVKVMYGIDDTWRGIKEPEHHEYPLHKWFGNHVIIRHENGEFSLYGHLDSIDVSLNDIIRRGQMIGKSGYNGRSIWPHLHFMVFVFLNSGDNTGEKNSIYTLKVRGILSLYEYDDCSYDGESYYENW